MTQIALPQELPTGALGVHPSETQIGKQKDFFSELVNKLAWTLGSTYGAPYSSGRGAVRVEAIVLATAVVRRHGYAKSIQL